MSVLIGKIREPNGKSAARKLRTDECIPAVVYGINDNVNLSINPKEVKKLIDTKGRNVLIELKVEGDAFFPGWSKKDWKEIARENKQDKKHKIKFSFVEYRRVD